MADEPFALWREVGGDDQETPLTGTVFAEFADIYAALGAQGMGQAQADDTQLMVVGAMLGLHRKDQDTSDTESLVAARMRHARGEGPKPEAKAPAGGQMAAMVARARNTGGVK